MSHPQSAGDPRAHPGVAPNIPTPDSFTNADATAIMSYDDLLAAQKLELQVADLCSELRAMSGVIDHAASSCKLEEDSESVSLPLAWSNDTERRQQYYNPDLPCVSVASRSSKDSITKQALIEQLVQLGSHIHTLTELGPEAEPRVKESPVRDARHDGMTVISTNILR